MKDELEQLLHDDDDMADLFLTRKMLGAPSSFPNSGVLNWAPPTATIVSTKVSDDDDVDELEMLLEVFLTVMLSWNCPLSINCTRRIYFTPINGILHKLTTVESIVH